jgi:hypothetical protein
MTKPKSGRFHWMKFWARDWLGDPALRSCSVAARGVWMDFICIMFEECSSGPLTLNGIPPTKAALARMVGLTLREYLPLEQELETAGVFSRRTTDGAIYCRRMVRDGVPEGSPERDPTESPGASNGHPPPARARTERLEAEKLDSDASHRPASEPPAKKPRKDPTGPQAECAEHWRREWARTRGGTKATLRTKDYVGIAWMLTQESPENVRARMTAILEDREAFMVKNASVKLLESKWDSYALAAAKPTRIVEPPDAEDIRSRWMILMGRRVRDGLARGVPDYPGHEKARADLAERASA